MEYYSILKQVEEQKKEKTIAGKMFRYSGLILAVDFFSQKLNSEQILLAAFDFVNELLTLESSYEFFFHDGCYKFCRGKGESKQNKSIKANDALSNFAVLHGSILTGREIIMKYFGNELYEEYKPEIVIPIIADRDLEGFILVPQRTAEILGEDDFIICEVLMKLFNGSMENFRRYHELQNINNSLDEKIFNLFAINHSSRALLSELELDSLYNLSIEVFSELTQSSSTGFILYDNRTEKYSLKSCKLIFESQKSISIELELRKSAVIEPNRIIIDLSDERDRNYFENLFTNDANALSELSPQYLVLLYRDSEILGFVTLGAPVTGNSYRQSVFELIESMASSTYLSISNAEHFKQVREQKILLQNKLDRLISLNNLTKNINSSDNIETLLEVTLNTLRISFGAGKCLIALYDSEMQNFRIKTGYGLGGGKKTIKSGRNWSRIFKGRTALVFNQPEMSAYFGKDFTECLDDVTAALIVPIYLDKSEIELLGVIVIFEFCDSIISDEENVLTMETIAGHIAPILYSLQIIEEQNTLLVPNYIEIFKKDLKKEITQAEAYQLDLSILKISSPEEFSFNCPDMADSFKKRYQKIYPIAFNTVFVITNEKVNASITENDLREITGIQGLTVKAYGYKQDFDSYTEFMS